MILQSVYIFLLLLLINSTSLFAEKLYNRFEQQTVSLYSYKPMYMGMTTQHNDSNITGESKFQYSFKYAVVDDGYLYIGYTQKSFWSVQKDSAPFRESNYAPELFYTFMIDGWMDYLQVGILYHESNGRDGNESVSLDLSYFEPSFVFDDWLISIKMWGPALFSDETSASNHNSEIFDYMGYGELNAIYHPYKGIQHSLIYRPGGRLGLSHIQYQFDLDIEYFIPFVSKTGLNPSFFMQLFRGYGESLETYNINSHRMTFGLSIVK